MTREQIIVEVAPCGIDCSRCIALLDGETRKHAIALQETFGDSFGRFAERFAGFVPVFAKYGEFREFIDFLAGVDCIGCRKSEKVRCGINTCYRSKGVDFCFECDEFPCDPEGIDDDLRQRWLAAGKRMREIGLEAWYEEMKKRPRYE
jgi:hypothetical protein